MIFAAWLAGTSSLPSRGAWIEIHENRRLSRNARSLPSRGAWIEMAFVQERRLSTEVAPLTGSVD